MTINNDIQQLEQLLDYTFNDKKLLVQALTHPSYLHEAGGAADGDYQRLEFLGDAVLGMLLAEMLCARHPLWDEGALSQLRSRLAGQDVLAERARGLRIGEFILLGRGEEHTAGRTKDSILADVLEALIAAIYLDGGLTASRKLIATLFDTLISAPELLVLGRDSKSELQELLSAKNLSSPEYILVEESGPPHDRQFVYQITIGDTIIGSGQGKSKKNAQQAAAAEALEILASSGRTPL